MTVTLPLTLTYGDPSPKTRDRIGIQLHNSITALYPADQATFYCDRFTGQGSWTQDDGDRYYEHSGVIVVALPADGRISSLRFLVSRIAQINGQDAIGFITSTDADPLVTAGN